MQKMLEEGVATRRGIMCSHREPVYAAQEPWSCGAGPGECRCPPGSCSRLLESEKAQDRCILLPLYHQMTEKDQERVIQALKTACNC
jgi:dTDP-4-amino-4,6-dideoxygalactose transaminase